MAKGIGPSFSVELKAAGLIGLPFSWGTDGDIQFDPRMTPAQRAAVLAVYAAHNPATPAPPDPRKTKLVAVLANPTIPQDLKAYLAELAG